MIRDRIRQTFTWVSTALRDDELSELDFHVIDDILDDCINQLYLAKAEIEEYVI